MSGLGNSFTEPTIVNNGGSPTTASTQALADATNSAFNVIDNVLGNMEGNTSTQAGTDLFENSVAGAIGDTTGLSPEQPYHISFTSYINTFNSSTTKEFILDLVPTGTLVINSPNDTTTWNQVSGRGNLENVGDFAYDGRSLLFLKTPVGQFTVTYNGGYPQNEGGLGDGYRPNVYPSPALMAVDANTKPTVTQVNSTTFNINFTQSRHNSFGDTFGGNLALVYGELLAPFVSNSSFIPAPLDMVSIWTKAAAGTNYRKLDCSSIYLMTNTEVEFVSTDTFNFSTDTFVLVISNVTVSGIVQALSRMLTNHAHDRYGNTKPISHAQLRDLIPISLNTALNYGQSAYVGNDHPQYFYREGYNQSDAATYNNAILGDVLLGSTDPSSLFNNILADSVRLVFGSISSGVSLKYSNANQALLLFSGQNGLNINSNMTNADGKQSYTLSLNGHQFFNYNIGGVGYLDIGSTNSKVRFTDNSGATLADIYARTLNAVNADISGNITFESAAQLIIGTIKLAQTTVGGKTGLQVSQTSDSTAIVEFDAPATFANSTHTIANITTGNLNTANILLNGRLQFGTTTQDQLANYALFADITEGSNTERTLQWNLSKPFKLVNTGRRTGLAFGSGITDEYGNIYTATPTGAPSTISASDTYWELHQGALYLLQTTNKTLSDATRQYVWQGTDSTTAVSNLQNWPKADLVAGNGTFTSLTVGAADANNTNGIEFGNNNNIYVTGSTGNCPAGYMVLASSNGVILVDASASTIDCSNLNYQNLTAGDIQSYGSVIAQTDVTAAGNVRAALGLIGGTLSISGTSVLIGATTIQGVLTLQSDLLSFAGATFNNDLTIKGSINVLNSANLNVLAVTGIATFAQLLQANSDLLVNGNATINQDLTVNGTLIANSNIQAQTATINQATISSLEVTGTLKADSTAEITGSTTIGGNLVVGQTIQATNNISTQGNLGGASLNISGNAAIQGTSIFTGGVTFSNGIVCNNQNASNNIAGSTYFTGAVQFSFPISTSSTATFGGQVQVNNSATFGSTIDVLGNATFESSITVAGQINAATLAVTGQANVGSLDLSGNLQGVNGTLTDNMDIGGNLSVDGQFTSTGTSQLSNTIVSGSFSQNNATSPFNVSGPATFTLLTANTVNSTVGNFGSTNQVNIVDGTINIGAFNNRGILNSGTVNNTGTITTLNLTATGTTNLSGIIVLSGNISANSSQIHNVQDPTSAQDAATMAWTTNQIAAIAGTGKPHFFTPILLGGGNLSSSWNTFDLSQFGITNASAAIVYMQLVSDGSNATDTIYTNPTSPTDGGEFAVFHVQGGGDSTSGEGGSQALCPVLQGKYLYMKSTDGRCTATLVGYI